MTDAATGPAGEISDRRRELESRLDSAQVRRQEVTEHLRHLQQERADRNADIDQYLADAEGERRRLVHAVDESRFAIDRAQEQELPYDIQREREEEGVLARGRLSEFEARASHETGQRRRQAADIEARIGLVGDERTELDRSIAMLSDELRGLVTNEQAEQRAHELEAELARLAPLVEAQREAVGESAATNLSEDYTEQAKAHEAAWKRWGVTLVVAIVVAVSGGLMLFREDSVPSGDLTNGAVVEVVRNLVIIGLLIYLVRLASLQFRVHRHLEAVARNKATALSTFNRMVVVASEPEIRNSLAIVLAQSVFSSEETGFVDAASDHVTLIERAVGSLPRPS
jgi:hypothetical protein